MNSWRILILDKKSFVGLSFSRVVNSGKFSNAKFVQLRIASQEKTNLVKLVRGWPSIEKKCVAHDNRSVTNKSKSNAVYTAMEGAIFVERAFLVSVSFRTIGYKTSHLIYVI